MTVPKYYDIAIETEIEASEIMGLLDDPTLLGGWDSEEAVHVYWPVEAWGEEKLRSLKSVLRNLGEDPTDEKIAVSILHGRDWNAEWAKNVRSVRIGRRILIRPSWETNDVAQGTIALVIDPKQAFGTGHHATTQLMIEWLEDRMRGGERVLDVGTGSGILAMVALRLGATLAIGIDHDPVAVDCAKEYAHQNGFGRELELRACTLADLHAGSFHFILANLDRRTLLDQAGQFQRFTSDDTVLLLSGILQEDHDVMVGALKQFGWKSVETREREGWVALEFRSGMRN